LKEEKNVTHGCFFCHQTKWKVSWNSQTQLCGWSSNLSESVQPNDINNFFCVALFWKNLLKKKNDKLFIFRSYFTLFVLLIYKFFFRDIGFSLFNISWFNCFYLNKINSCRVIFGDQGYLISFWLTKLFNDFWKKKIWI